MADINLESQTPVAIGATDAAIVRRGSGPYTAELVTLGDAAAKNTGTTAGTVAAGDHTHTTAAISGLAAVAMSGSASDLGTGTLPAARLSLTKAQLNAAVSDGDPLYVGDVTSNATHTGDVTGATALTLATVNSDVGSFGSATQVATFTVNAKGLTTAAGNTSIAIPASQVTDFNSATRAQVEAELIAGANITITPAGSGATRTLTIAASGSGGGGFDFGIYAALGGLTPY